MRARAALAIAFCCACSPSFDDASGVLVTCDDAASCPKGYVCSSVGACVHGLSDEPLALASATATSPTSILVAFTQPIVPSYAGDPSRYAVNLGVSVMAAEVQSSNTVRLTTSALQTRHYELTVAADMVDRYGAPIGQRTLQFLGSGDFIDEAAPTLLAPVDKQVFNALQAITLAWSPAVGATSYSVEVALDDGFASLVTTIRATDGATTATFVTPARASYYWRVIADTTLDPLPRPGRFSVSEIDINVYCAPDDDCEEGASIASVWENGNVATPFKSIARALSEATLRGADYRIRIAARTDDGSVAYNEAFTIAYPVTIEGGYDAHFSTPPDRNTHRTVIRSASEIRIVGQSTTTLTGLEIRNTSSDGIALHVADCRSETSVNDTAADRTLIESIVGEEPIHVRNSQLAGLTIRGGAPELSDVVVAGDLTASGTTALLERVTVRGRLSSSGGALRVRRATLDTIDTTGADTIDASIIASAVDLAASGATLTNSIIGAPDHAARVIVESGVFANNTLFGSVVVLRDAATIVNVLMVCDADAEQHAAVTREAGSSSLALENSVGVGCASLFCEHSSGKNWTCYDQGDLPDDSEHRFAADALVESSLTDIFAQPFDGLWSLRPDGSGTLAINRGGKNASLATCGIGGNTSCGAVSTDFVGAARTTPYAVGARESAP